jgi:RNA polymerase sigma-70 factor (ECF subfamily)
MASADPEFDDLMRRVRAGCPDAVRVLFERYSDHIRRLVRRRLHRRLRSQYDSLDFVQSVWASFIQIPAERYHFDAPDDLVGYLARVAYHKVVDAFRDRIAAAKRDANREVSLEQSAGQPEGDPLPVRAPEPTPSQVAIAGERWERLREALPPRYRQALELLRQGYTQLEVADRLRLNPKLVHRLVQKLTRLVERS